ncbi:MAG: hypothetical protein KME07_06580 [Pegethrix bostrychoides GSE-TBD4-15B]|jgi:hypothetical protein|uniref:Uncharacterized protein n=1 Tax=Pegethrix bostrychoides GSE-TBD4-15B TaxID=2839662 RepID=A0A951U464_9CYAN|nr:hypothetical protein [Pegethrix bostrychoides GSE-TBD4-15B]
MDDLEKMLEFVEIEITLAEGLEEISKIEVQHSEELYNWAKQRSHIDNVP